MGIEADGIDAIPEFIACASKRSQGRFMVLPYKKVSNANLIEKYDVVVCNFSLLGNEVVSDLFQRIPSLLENSGALIVQTIHPISGCGDKKYEDGWREGSWSGFNDQFCDPAPWYFRTIESWKSLFQRNGFTLSKIVEPMNQKTKNPASIVFVAEIVN